MQRCELVAVDASGNADPSMLGEQGGCDAAGLKQILASGEASAATVRAGLERRGVDLSKARAIALFGGESRAGSEANFTVARDGLLIAAVPGSVMDAGTQDTATPIRLFIRRSHIARGAETALPEPLADPLQADVILNGLIDGPDDSAAAALAEWRRLCEERRDLDRQLRLHALLHGWLLIHVPATVALLLLLTGHVVVAWRHAVWQGW